jgi:predicted membrane-bound dolichyl-phosphate-mannose-protein mannosyltransferase
MELALYPLLVGGLVLALSFFVVHRPRHWWRPEAINAVGLIWVIAALYARALIVMMIRGGPKPFESAWDALFSLGMAALIDAYLAFRLITFLRYRRNHRATP